MRYCLTFERGVRVAVVFSAVLGSLFLAEVAPGQGGPSTRAMIEEGVSRLIDMQEGDHWTCEYTGTATETTGTTAICAEALLAAARHVGEDEDLDEHRLDALAAATRYLLSHSETSGAGGLFRLQFFLHLQRSGQQLAGVDPTAVTLAIKTLIGNTNSAIQHVNPSGPRGYPYSGGMDPYRDPYSVFFQAPALYFLAGARDAGYTEVDRTGALRATYVLESSRVTSGPHQGAYTYQCSTEILEECSDPPESTPDDVENVFSCKLATIPGSLSRIGICESARARWDRPMGENYEDLRRAIGLFFDETPAFNGKSAYEWLVGQKGKGGHEPDAYMIADYFILWAHYFTAVAIETLWDEAGELGCPECPSWRAALVERLRSLRNADGTWSERCAPGTTDPTCTTAIPPDGCAGNSNCIAASKKKNYCTAAAILTLLAPEYMSGIPVGDGELEVRGIVFNDVNADGTPQASDTRLADWTVCLKSTSRFVHRHDATDTLGVYAFTDLPPATDYTVTPLAPPGWELTYKFYSARDNRLGLRRGFLDSSVSRYSSVCGYGDLAFLGHGEPGATDASELGVDIIDISEPCYPRHLLTWKPEGGCGNFEDIEIRDGIGFFASSSGCGVFILDVRPLPESPPVVLRQIHSDEFGPDAPDEAQSICVDENLLFIAGGTSEVPVFEVSDPADPRWLATIHSPSGGIITGVEVSRPYLLATIPATDGSGGIEVIDIGNLSGPGNVGRIPLTHVHSVWPSPGGCYAYAVQRRPINPTAGFFDVTIWSFGEFRWQPDPKAILRMLNPAATSWSPYSVVADGDVLYAAWCQAGVLAFDVSMKHLPCQAENASSFSGPFPENPCPSGQYPVGHFDTFPGAVVNDYQGATGVYPFLGPDRILVCDSSGGLSILSSMDLTSELSLASNSVTDAHFLLKRKPASSALLSADFAAGLPSGWTRTGLWHATSTACRVTLGEAAPSAWVYYGKDSTCNFNNGSTNSGILRAPSVSLPANARSATLKYASAYQGRGGDSNSGTGFDWAWVAANGTEVDDVSRTAPQRAWQLREVDLTPYLGQSVNLTWNFNSRDKNTGTALGWQVAQVEVVAELDPQTEAACVVRGTVFHDFDADGAKENLEAGLQEITVYLDRNGNSALDAGEPARTTDASGNFEFSGLYPSTLVVAAVLPQGWTQTSPDEPLGRVVWHWNQSKDYADVWAENGFAFMGHFDEGGVDIFDISDPQSPEYLWTWNDRSTPNPLAHTADIKVKGHIAYFANDSGGGVYVVDLDCLEERVAASGNTVLQPCTVTSIAQSWSDTNDDGTIDGADELSVHNIFVDGDYLYVADYYSPVLRVFSIVNPRAPAFHEDIDTSTYNATDRIHDVVAKDQRLYVSEPGDSSGRVHFFSIGSNPVTHRRTHSRLGTLDTGDYTHSCWPITTTSSQGTKTHLVVTKEPPPIAQSPDGNTVQVYDISDLPWSLTSPRVMQPVNEIQLDPAEASSAHHPRIFGNTLYLSWYEAGVLSFDLTNPLEEKPTGRFDTYACTEHCRSDANCYTGCWGVHPFLGPDAVLATDTETGLYVLGPRRTHEVSLRPGEAAGSLNFGLWKPGPEGVMYVHPSATGKNDGSSWTNAYTTLDRAFTYGRGSEFWVARGTYYAPYYREASLNIPSGKAVYGGFAGWETTRDARNPSLQPTVLTGAYYRNYHVVKAYGTSSSTILDGFVITGGCADGTYGDANGGGGLYVSGSLTVRNCRFLGNSAVTYGGGAFCAGGSVSIINCVFSGNTCTGYGGALFSKAGSTCTLVNCSFSSNHCGYIGGGVVSETGAVLSIKNSILYGNTGGLSTEQNQVYMTKDANHVVSYSCVQGLSVFSGNGNISGFPAFVNPLGADCVKGTLDDDLHIGSMTSCKDKGDNGAVTVTRDLDFNPRIVGGIVDMGAYERQ